jgi:hypothetical protein
MNSRVPEYPGTGSLIVNATSAAKRGVVVVTSSGDVIGAVVNVVIEYVNDEGSMSGFHSCSGKASSNGIDVIMVCPSLGSLF